MSTFTEQPITTCEVTVWYGVGGDNSFVYNMDPVWANHFKSFEDFLRFYRDTTYHSDNYAPYFGEVVRFDINLVETTRRITEVKQLVKS